MKKKKIGLIGAGYVGTALAKRLVALGHSVLVANSRGPQTLTEFTRRTGATAVEVAALIPQVEILFLAIPLGRVGQLRAALQALAPGAILVDTGNYIPQRDGLIEAIEQGLPETSWVAEQLGLPVVKAFNNIIASRIITASRPLSAVDRVVLPVAADDARARKTIMELVEQVGFTAYDAGALTQSWRQQPGQPAYCTDPTGNELSALLAQADRRTAPAKRDKALAVMIKIPVSFPAQDLVRVSRLSIGLDRLKLSSWLAMVRFVYALSRRGSPEASALAGVS